MVEKGLHTNLRVYGVQTDGRAKETKIFEWDVHKFVWVNAFTIFDQVYVTDHNL